MVTETTAQVRHAAAFAWEHPDAVFFFIALDDFWAYSHILMIYEGATWLL
jgi:alkylation response protein AidB-like acyl-CoA dehydrogenase